MPWQERGFMLYTNEEPLVQRTCIKTASLQSEKLVTRKSVSEKAQSEELSHAGKRLTKYFLRNQSTRCQRS